MPQQPSYRENVLPVIRGAREMLLPHYGRAEFSEKRSGRRFELVTELDTRVEDFLEDALARRYPDIAFVGEERGGDKDAERFWLVDPIDGTAHFVRGIPFCTVMLALIENGRAVFSAIYDFVGDIMYHAERGGGAFVNGERIRVNAHPLRGAYLVWETHLQKEENLRWFLKLKEESILWHPGPAGFELALVASGKLDGRVCVDPYGHEYDFAPGALLVQEAGGVVANIGARDYDYRNGNFIAANPLVFKELTEGPAALFPIQS